MTIYLGAISLNLKQPNEEEKNYAIGDRRIPWSLRARMVNVYRRILCRHNDPRRHSVNPTSTFSTRRSRNLLRRRSAKEAARLRRQTAPMTGPGSRKNWFQVNEVRLGHEVTFSTGKNRPSKKKIVVWVQRHTRIHLMGTCNQWSEQRGRYRDLPL